MSDSIQITIDGVEVSAALGQSVLEAAEKAGIYIPRLCAMKGLPPHGSCRVCTVMINGRPQAACTTPVAPGMLVENASARILELRRDIVEMLLVEGNHLCMFCEASGDCELQATAYRLGITAPRYPYAFPNREIDATHPDVYLDRNRCILCARCVRASRDLDGRSALGFLGRGRRKRVAPDAAGGLGATRLQVADRAASACPVGALRRKRAGYAVPVGLRRYDHAPIGSEVEQSAPEAPAEDERTRN